MSDQVKQLSLVICLPFKIRRTDKGKESLQHTRAIIQQPGTSWKAKADSAPATPAHRWSRFQDYQARVYFHPFVRRFLYDSTKVARYTRCDVEKVSVTIKDSTKDFTSVLNVASCELVLFQPSIGVLLLRLESSVALTLKQTQSLMDSLRRVYPPYFDNDDWRLHEKKPPNKINWDGGHCPIEVHLLNAAGDTISTGVYRQTRHKDNTTGSMFDDYVVPVLHQHGEHEGDDKPPLYPWATHWQTLLHPFDCCGSQPESPLRAEQLGDDRAPIMCWIAVDTPRAISRGDWMRLCFADDPGGNPLPYAAPFIQDFEKDFCYDRFWYKGSERSRYNGFRFTYSLADSSYSPSRILNSGYAFSYVGSEQDGFFMNDKNGSRPIFDNIYVEMGLIAHFQKAALLSFSERLTSMVSRKDEGGIKNQTITMPDAKDIQNFYDDFIEFTQVFWFDEISPQEQGREIFQKWREKLRIEELYCDVRQQLQDLVEYVELKSTGKLNRTVLIFAGLSLPVSILTLLAGFYGMNNFKLDDHEKTNLSDSTCWTDIETCWLWDLFSLFAGPTVLFAIGLIVFAFLLWVIYVKFLKKQLTKFLAPLMKFLN